MASVALTIVIPAYNEGDNISVVLDDTLTTLAQADDAEPFEIIVVDDGSSDHTGTVARDYARRFASIRVLLHESNQGLGAALRIGFTHSVGDYVGWIPADGEVRADQVLKLLRIADGADLITSTRLGDSVQGPRQPRTLFRGFLTWWMNIFFWACLGNYPKHATGIYMARGAHLRSVPLTSSTGLVGMELYLQSVRRNAKFRHGECEIGPRLSGRSKVATPTGILKSMLEILRLGISLGRSRRLKHDTRTAK
jgi:glycosyltransferase involved in cell wall biosynthesis